VEVRGAGGEEMKLEIPASSIKQYLYIIKVWRSSFLIDNGVLSSGVRTTMLSKPKSRKVASLLAFSGVVIPVSGLHKFYLGQPWWGVLYLLLSWTPIPRVASAIEGVWYLLQNSEQFDQNFNGDLIPTGTSAPSQIPEVDPAQVGAIADALRQLDKLRQEGLMSEYEFEQKRRQLLDRIA